MVLGSPPSKIVSGYPGFQPISYRWTLLSYFVPTKTRPTYICTRVVALFERSADELFIVRQTEANWDDSGQQMFRHTIFDKRGAIIWWLFEELLKVFTWLVGFRYQLSIISALIRKYIANINLHSILNQLLPQGDTISCNGMERNETEWFRFLF
jgi:hypothetical protein